MRPMMFLEFQMNQPLTETRQRATLSSDGSRLRSPMSLGWDDVRVDLCHDASFGTPSVDNIQFRPVDFCHSNRPQTFEAEEWKSDFCQHALSAGADEGDFRQHSVSSNLPCGFIRKGTFVTF
jgi:hypothetical protein